MTNFDISVKEIDNVSISFAAKKILTFWGKFFVVNYCEMTFKSRSFVKFPEIP